MGGLSREFKIGEGPLKNLWELLFVDDLAIMAVSGERLQERLEKW